MASHRITLRVSDSLVKQLETTAHQQGTTVSDIARQWLAHPDAIQTSPPHMLGDCAAALVQRCIPEVRDSLQAQAATHGITLDTLVTAILGTWLRRWQTATRREAEPPLW
jgi:predicted HicB family RNase H-like nuclease